MTPHRPLHPDDARALIDGWRSRMASSEAEIDARRDELPGIIRQCLEARLELKEIAERAGVSRNTIYRYLSLKA